MLFSNVIGQNGIRSKLVDMVSHNRLGHALLFTAPDGAGGLPLALSFSQFMVAKKFSRPEIRHHLFLATSRFYRYFRRMPAASVRPA